MMKKLAFKKYIKECLRSALTCPVVNKTCIRPLFFLRNIIPLSFLNRIPVVGEIHFKTSEGVSFKMMSPRGLDSIASKIFWSNKYGHEPEVTRLFQDLLKDARVIMDIGANTGFISLMAASYALKSTIYAFEPVPDIYHLLKTNIEANHFKHCCPVLSAVSDHNGHESFYVPQVRPIPLSGSLDKRFYSDSHEIKVSSTTVDNFVKEHEIQKCGFC